MDPTLRNPARERLAAGDLALGVGIRQSRTVDIASIMKACGYDWLFLDLEHNSMDLDTAVQIAVAALGAGIAAVARVPAGQLWLATRFLDGGGLGIVVPHVDTPEEAQHIAQALRYPPRGRRSVPGAHQFMCYRSNAETARLNWGRKSPAKLSPRLRRRLQQPFGLAPRRGSARIDAGYAPESCHAMRSTARPRYIRSPVGTIDDRVRAMSTLLFFVFGCIRLIRRMTTGNFYRTKRLRC